MSQISDKVNQPALVLLAYGRPRSLERALRSLALADYGNRKGVRLIISIDRSDCQEVYDIAEQFEWVYGEKEILAHEKKLGMREHSLFCGDLVQQYGSIIFLEDDSFLSGQFFDFSLQAREFYSDKMSVAGISLYGYSFNELTGLIFIPLDDGFDNYFVQSATTWGVLWTERQWRDFREWLVEFGADPVTVENGVPTLVASWPETSWKKYINKYLIMENKYFVYPRCSLLTNFADAGIHNEAATNNYQVPLLIGEKRFRFSALRESGAVYDAHFEMQPDCIKRIVPSLRDYDLEMDLFGLKNADMNSAEFLLTAKNCRNAQKEYGFDMKVPELNVLFDIPGSFFALARRKDVGKLPRQKTVRLIKQCQSDLGLVTYARLLGDNAGKLLRHRMRKLMSSGS